MRFPVIMLPEIRDDEQTIVTGKVSGGDLIQSISVCLAGYYIILENLFISLVSTDYVLSIKF